MPKIKFIKEKKEIEVLDGTNLRTAALDCGITVNNGVNGVGKSFNNVMNCHGLGLCGTCLVKITKGMEHTNSMGVREKFKFTVPVPDPLPVLARIGNEDTLRLACLTKVYGDVEVETSPEINFFGENFFS